MRSSSSYYERFKQWFNMENCNPAEQMNDLISVDRRTIVELQAELYQLRSKVDSLNEDAANNRYWTHTAKERAGYDTNVSFDVVFDELLAAAKQNRVDTNV